MEYKFNFDYGDLGITTYDLKYEEDRVDYGVGLEYINSLVLDSAIFKTLLFFSVTPYNSRPADTLTPLETLKEAKGCDSTFASFNTNLDLDINPTIALEEPTNTLNVNRFEGLTKDNAKDGKAFDKPIGLDKLSEANWENAVYLGRQRGSEAVTQETAINLSPIFNAFSNDPSFLSSGNAVIQTGNIPQFIDDVLKRVQGQRDSQVVANRTNIRDSSVEIPSLSSKRDGVIDLKDYMAFLNVLYGRANLTKSEGVAVSKPTYETSFQGGMGLAKEDPNIEKYSLLFGGKQENGLHFSTMDFACETESKESSRPSDYSLSKRNGDTSFSDAFELDVESKGALETLNVGLSKANNESQINTILDLSSGVNLANQPPDILPLCINTAGLNELPSISVSNGVSGLTVSTITALDTFRKEVLKETFSLVNKAYTSNEGLLGKGYVLDVNPKSAQGIASNFLFKDLVKGHKEAIGTRQMIALSAGSKGLSASQVIELSAEQSDLFDLGHEFFEKMTKGKKGLNFSQVISASKFTQDLNVDLGFLSASSQERAILASGDTTFAHKDFPGLTSSYSDGVVEKEGYDLNFFSESVAGEQIEKMVKEGMVNEQIFGFRDYYQNRILPSTSFSKMDIGVWFPNDLFAAKTDYRMSLLDFSYSVDKRDNELNSNGINLEFQSFLSKEIDLSQARKYVSVDTLFKPTYSDISPMFVEFEGRMTSVGDNIIATSPPQKNVGYDIGIVPDNFLSRREVKIGLFKAALLVGAPIKDIADEVFVISVDSTTKDINYDDCRVIIDSLVYDTGIGQTYKTLDSIIRPTELELEQVRIDSFSKPVVNDAEQIRISSILKDIRENIQGSLLKNYRNAVPFIAPEGLEKPLQGIFLDNSLLSFDIELAVKVFKQTIPNMEVIKLLHEDEGGFAIEKGNIDTLKNNENYFVPKSVIEATIDSQVVGLKDKEIKELMMDNGVWSWDVNGDKLDLTADGVDELLLPQLDFDYTLSKEDLIDPVTHKPLRPINVFPDGSFTASMPINHPLPEYKEIAKEYLEVSVSLLRYLISNFHKIWQANIFQFGALDMRASVAKMLEHMETYITLNIPTPLMAQALRVLRLMRWYGEASILKHSEYKIKYVYEELKSDLFTGDCQIPYTWSNMYVDTTKYTITNAVLNQDAYIEFDIDNPVATKITFQSYMSSGVLEVYINAELQETVTLGYFKGEYELPYVNGQKNKVKLFFKDDNSGIINLTNIVISDMIYSDIVTEYSPVVGAGNKALDDLMKRLGVYSDIIDNNDQFVQDTIFGNLAITDLAEKLNEYFELHHEKKKKGKRKTVKK